MNSKKKRVNVAIFLNTTPEMGGQYQYALLLMKSLLKIKDPKFKIYAVCANREWGKWCKKNNVSIIYNLKAICEKQYSDIYWINIAKMPKLYWKIKGYYLQFFTELGKKMSRKNIDICLYSDETYPQFYNIQTICIVHDLMHRYQNHFPEVKKGYCAREAKNIILSKNSDIIVVDSKLGKQQFVESYFKGTNKSEKKVISLPFISPKLFLKQEEATEELKVIKESLPSKYIFYPAQFWKHKNHINLLKSIKILEEKIENISLVLVGSEKNEGNNIRNFIKQNKLQDRIIIYGFVSDAVIDYLYKNAVALIMPTYFGPTNIPPLEAMQIGCPVLVSNNYGMKEQVGAAGILFNPDSPKEMASAIERVWNDAPLRETMIAKGKKRVEKWGEKEFQDRLLQILCQLSVNS